MKYTLGCVEVVLTPKRRAGVGRVPIYLGTAATTDAKRRAMRAGF